MKEKIKTFLDNKPLIGTVAVFFAGQALVQILGATIDTLIKSAVPAYPDNIVSTVMALAALVLFKKIFSPDYEGSLRLKGTLKGMLFLWPVYVLILLSLYGNGFNISLSPAFPVLLMAAVWAGVNEDICSRALPISFAMRHFNSPKYYPWIVFITGMVFGMSHYLNIIAGGFFWGSTRQVIYASCLGMLYAAVFLRTGSILPCIISHTLNDIIIFMLAEGANSAAAGVNTDSGLSLSGILVPLIMYLPASFFIIRKKKHDEIEALWEKKWDRA